MRVRVGGLLGRGSGLFGEFEGFLGADVVDKLEVCAVEFLVVGGGEFSDEVVGEGGDFVLSEALGEDVGCVVGADLGGEAGGSGEFEELDGCALAFEGRAVVEGLSEGGDGGGE